MSDTIDHTSPDLSTAEPIAAVIQRLAPLRNGYSWDFLRECEKSGIGVNVRRNKDGVDGLSLGFPMDGQEELRNARAEALIDQLKRGKFRRRQVIDHLNLIGRFTDEQAFASIEEAAQAYIAAGGRIWITPAGKCEEALNYNRQTAEQEGWTGFPLRRLAQRYQVTLWKRGARDAMTAYVAKHGKLHEGSGCVVLEAEGKADA